jgi:hypothetical protein
MPIILLCGKAGSGKDSLAAAVTKAFGNGKSILSISQADPMKRLAKAAFGFTDEQLWGPSEARNAVDRVFSTETNYLTLSKAWRIAHGTTMDSRAWIKEVLPGLGEADIARAEEALKKWCDGLFYDHYDTDKNVAIKGLSPRTVLQTLGTEWGRAFSASMWNDAAIAMAKKLLGGGYDYDKTKGAVARAGARCGAVIISDGRFLNEIIGVKSAGGVVVKVENPDQDAGVNNHISETELDTVPAYLYDYVVVNDKKNGLEGLQHTAYTLLKEIFKHPKYINNGRVPLARGVSSER